MTREDPQMKVRLPVDLKDRLAELAAENGRSINAEVVRRLEESLASEGKAVRTVKVDNQTLDLFAEKVGEVLGGVLDERDKRRKSRL
ncbi:Arc family DNA-binding protein [Paraburkholderia sp. BR10936]|uniref:Arc family DNA-binding protein n=1 Tax=Paraburkholderia sp. BR10936 TaxID=3236993 RepID=UPI0034D2AFF0